jgi:hypothetical protein
MPGDSGRSYVDAHVYTNTYCDFDGHANILSDSNGYPDICSDIDRHTNDHIHSECYQYFWAYAHGYGYCHPEHCDANASEYLGADDYIYPQRYEYLYGDDHV